MEQSKIIKGNRLYHALFGWCRVVSPVIGNKVLVDLEADSIKFYQIGKGYKTISRKPDKTNIILTPTDDLFQSENISRDMEIKRLAFKPEIKKYCNCDNDECESNLIVGRNCQNCINKL